MDQSLHLFSENLLHMLRGALMMLFVVMCVGLYPQRKQNPIQNYLFWLLVVMAAFLLVSFVFMFEEVKNNEVFRNFKTVLDLCLVPMVGSLFMKILIPEYINGRKTILLLIPAIVLMIIYTCTHNKLLLTLSFIYSALVAVIIFSIVVYVSLRYDRFLKNNFSNIDDKSVGWVRVTIYVFATWYLVWSLILKTDNRWIDSAYYLFLIIIWVFIYRHSVRHIAAVKAQELFKQQQFAEIIDNNKTAYSTDKFVVTLEKCMVEIRPWINPSLTLNELADMLNTNRTYLSEYFNKKLDTTFYDYLNKFRIDHACEILLSEPKLSLVTIGEQSGFNSLSTFRRAFEKFYGYSPATYRKMNGVN